MRHLRTESGTPAAAWVPLHVEPVDADAQARLEPLRGYLETLARVRPIQIGAGEDRPALVAASPLGAAWLGIDAATADAVAARRRAQLDEIDRNIARLRALLANEEFTGNAPAAVVERERLRLSALEEERRQLETSG